MNIILLSGGSGKRLWPLSNEVRSKQFLKIFKRSDGAHESMVQRMYRMINEVDPNSTITIATSKSQVSVIHNQIGLNVGISVEPCRRDTFPAIALAVAYLRDVKNIGEDEAVVVCPVDPYVNEEYFKAIQSLWELAKYGTANLALMGIDPTYPSEKYGYIMPVSKESVSKVSEFKEKPDAETAQEYIDKGGLWNAGVFAFKLGYVLERAHELIDFVDYSDLFSKYDVLKKISFDYAVVEHEKNIEVLRFAGEWKDLGTWNTLIEAMEETCMGDVRLDDTCKNVHAINELGIPLLIMGGNELIVSASPDGILVSTEKASDKIKPYVDDINQQIMFAEKSWGRYQVIDVEDESLTIKITLIPNYRMNYHSHERRDEVWTVIRGTGRTIVDGMEQPIKPGDVITMSAGCKHTVIAGEDGLQLIEVQLGTDISVADKRKYELE